MSSVIAKSEILDAAALAEYLSPERTDAEAFLRLKSGSYAWLDFEALWENRSAHSDYIGTRATLSRSDVIGRIAQKIQKVEELSLWLDRMEQPRPQPRRQRYAHYGEVCGRTLDFAGRHWDGTQNPNAHGYKYAQPWHNALGRAVESPEWRGSWWWFFESDWYQRHNYKNGTSMIPTTFRTQALRACLAAELAHWTARMDQIAKDVDPENPAPPPYHPETQHDSI